MRLNREIKFVLVNIYPDQLHFDDYFFLNFLLNFSYFEIGSKIREIKSVNKCIIIQPDPLEFDEFSNFNLH